MVHALSTPYRRRLWDHADWSVRLSERADELMGAADAPVDEVLELAALCERMVPDGAVAVQLYGRAFASGADEAYARRAAVLARELGDFLSVAQIKGMQYERSGETSSLRAQAVAMLDAGLIAGALPLLRRALSLAPDDADLHALERAASGDYSTTLESMRQREREAQKEKDGRLAAPFLLSAARLARLWPESDDWEQLLMRAFDADPTNQQAFVLLENCWIESRQWKRLGNLYRIQTQRAVGAAAQVEAYRRSGMRLILQSESPGTGVRLLQQAVTIVYQRDLETVPQLVAMLGLLSDCLVLADATPSAIRLLAQGLAHPRSDDEAMWIVNRGLSLAAGDAAMRRTVANFEVLRANLLLSEPTILAQQAVAEIGDEVNECTRPGHLGPEVAERAFVVADVNIAVRAEVSTRNGKASAMTRDLSETGLFLASDVVLAQDESVTLSILMPGEDDWSLTEHELTGVVARVVPGIGYGVRFSSVPEQFLSDVRALCPAAKTS